MLEKFPEDISNGRITCLHTKSDNAASHFKSRKSLNYFSRLINERDGPANCAYVYSFGASHHGKGKWDGAGGCMKHKVDQATSSSMTTGTISYTASGYIKIVTDVYDCSVYHFQDGAHRDQKTVRNGFNNWRFHLYTSNKNPVPRPDESFTPLKDILSNYQFAIRQEGVLYNQRRVCYCLFCIEAIRFMMTEWNGEKHNIMGCCMSGVGNDTDETNVYTFNKSRYERTSGPNVTQRMQQDRRSINKKANALNIGD